MEQNNPRIALSDRIATLTSVLEKNEQINEQIIRKQTEISKGQLKVSLIFGTIVTLFFIASAIYVNYMVALYIDAGDLREKKTAKKQSVELTVRTINEMMEWSETAEKQDPVYALFLNADYNAVRDYINKTAAKVKTNKKGKTTRSNPTPILTSLEMDKKTDKILMENPNINKFYGYYEILKNYDHSGLLDHQVAFDMLYYFKSAGENYELIEKIRKDAHKTGEKKCDCGLIYNGYEHIYEKIFKEKLQIEGPNDIPEN